MSAEELVMSAESRVDAASLDRIAIVGRPNVGKSTLLNRMCGRRVSIVEPTAGVTRDRVAVPARLRTSLGEHWYEVIDTGGIGIVDRDDLSPHVESQVRAALLSARLVLFVVDARDGLTPMDQEVARRLRALTIPVILVVNKVEGDRPAWEVEAFRRLGVTEGPFAISTQNGEGLGPLYERIVDLMPPQDGVPRTTRPHADTLKLAVVGRRNAGKSTLINQLAGEERVIVSEVPGTTRDAVDVLIERDRKSYVLIDTAGVRRKKHFQDAVDFFSDTRSLKAVRRADVVLLLFDATGKLSSLEKKLARYAVDQHKPVVLCANKWDLATGVEPGDYEGYLGQELPGLSYAPVSFLSAHTGLHVWQTLALAEELHAQAGRRVGTGELNRVLERALSARSPSRKGHGVRVRYATQTDVHPPTFVLFVNDRRRIGKDYLRYLENRLREELPISEVPLRILLRDRSSAAPENSSKLDPEQV